MRQGNSHVGSRMSDQVASFLSPAFCRKSSCRSFCMLPKKVYMRDGRYGPEASEWLLLKLARAFCLKSGCGSFLCSVSAAGLFEPPRICSSWLTGPANSISLLVRPPALKASGARLFCLFQIPRPKWAAATTNGMRDAESEIPTAIMI